MKIKLTIAIATLVILPLMAKAEHDEDHPLFSDQELNIDLFGTLSAGQQTINHLSKDRVTDDGRLGAGAGISYFFIRNVGVGADAYTENTGHSFVDKVSGSVIVRFPFESVHLSPYIFGGGGHQFDPEYLWFGQVGGGLEVRVMRNWGFFIDGRYMIMGEGADDVGLGRLGLRLAF